MIMKRILSMFSALVLALSLVSCGSTGGTTSSDGTASSTAASVNAANSTMTSSTDATSSSVTSADVMSSTGVSSTTGSSASRTQQSAASSKSTQTKPTGNSGSSQTKTTSSKPETPSPAVSKILVAYFSYSGHTRTVANQIHQQVGGDIFEIKTVHDYPSGYNDVLAQAQKEKNENARPALNAQVKNMSEYGTVFLGYPNWWGDMPMAIYSFLDEYNLSGKKIIPFNTSGGSGFSNTISSIKHAEPGATVLEGLTIRDTDVPSAEGTITAWLRRLGMIK